MINLSNIVNGGTTGVPPMILAIIAIYLVFYKDLNKKPHKSKKFH